MAAVVLEDGFVANFPVDLINFRPSEAEFSRSPSDTIEEIEYANRRRFRGHGLNSENVYAQLLRRNFSIKIQTSFLTFTVVFIYVFISTKTV